MNYTIENEDLRVVISSLGAEVQSVVRKSDDKELWWQGDPRFWDGRSPILFPAYGMVCTRIRVVSTRCQNMDL